MWNVGSIYKNSCCKWFGEKDVKCWSLYTKTHAKWSCLSIILAYCEVHLFSSATTIRWKPCHLLQIVPLFYPINYQFLFFWLSQMISILKEKESLLYTYHIDKSLLMSDFFPLVQHCTFSISPKLLWYEKTKLKKSRVNAISCLILHVFKFLGAPE